MIITIAGMPGSGKSTLAREIAKYLKMKHYSMGDLQRQFAKERRMTITELGIAEEKDPSLDNEIDSRQKELGEKNDDFVIDSRLGFHFIPHSFKIFLKVDMDVAARRIFIQKRAEEKEVSLTEVKRKLLERIASEKKRYKAYYGIDHYALSNYDCVIDTTSLKVANCVKVLLTAIEKHKKKPSPPPVKRAKNSK